MSSEFIENMLRLFVPSAYWLEAEGEAVCRFEIRREHGDYVLYLDGGLCGAFPTPGGLQGALIRQVRNGRPCRTCAFGMRVGNQMEKVCA